MHFTARALGVLFLLLELSSAIPAEVPPPSITAAPSILDAVQNQRRGDDSPTSTSSIQPKHFAPFRDGLLMCRAGNREAFNYTLGNKQHYMEQSKIKHMIKYQVCNSLKEDHSDVPDKGKEWALTYEDHGDDYKHYHILVRWNNGHTCGRNSTVFFDESKCNDLIGGIADKCAFFLVLRRLSRC
ncbi:hypothetical protein N7492_004002 [Penicillium capsulatum]|uniref:Uncharacterized protein n=1 Tax=Penicillium capsulatum TaxID=69766 RepID=A0A9W9IN33_9EURO|nr:hypothetical protein N7492_004002 [Penicillium capsulatum]